MIPLSEANFVVVDVETSGSHATENRVTDIACISVRDFQIVDSYQSLVNPHQKIPWYIQKMTGIYDLMVMDAPEPFDVFGQVRELLEQENTFFVAHNVSFDWQFVYQTLLRERLYMQEIPQICTLKIGNKIIPSNIRKNVGSLAEYFHIPIINRHRAYDDAFATAIFFIEMLHILQDRYDINTVEELIRFQDKAKNKTKKVDKKIIERLTQYQKFAPQFSGVVSFITKDGQVLHISRTNNIAEYIASYIEQSEVSSPKVKSILKTFARLEWLETQNELELNVIEHRKIKQFQPKYNNIQMLDLYNADDIRINEISQTLLVRNLSMVVLIPNSERERTIDLYFINRGLYVKTITIGSKAALNVIFDTIHDIFYPEQQDKLEIDIDEIKIINNWLRKHQYTSKKFVYNDQEELIFGENIERGIRNFFTQESEDDGFYIGNFIYG